MATSDLTSAVGAAGGFWNIASPIVGAAVDAIGAVGGGLFSANQARKNRAFQERMYYKQLDDNRENWKMQNEYNLPSAQLQRLKDAGLNPLLMYGQGGVSNTVASPAAGASAPSGSAAHGNFQTNFGQALYQAAMMKEQLGLMRAEREKKETERDKLSSEIDWQEIENRFSQETYDVRKAIQYGNWDYLKTSMDKMRTEMYNSSQITTQQVLTMCQARQYEIKRFNLDADYRGTMLEQGWERLKNEKVQANAAWKNAAAAMLDAMTKANIAKWQIGAIQQDIAYRAQLQPYVKHGLSLDNMLKSWDTHLRKASLTEKQVNIVNGTLKNFYLGTYGSETFEPGSLGKDIRYLNNQMNSLFLLPPMQGTRPGESHQW